MRFWIIQMGELLRGVDGDVRDYRYMLLARQLANRGHEVVRWGTTFEHISKKFRFPFSTTISVTPRLTLRLLHAEPAYRRNICIDRFRQQRQAAQLFRDEMEDWPKPDLIFAGVPVPEWAEASCEFGHRHGIPVVVDVQDQWPDIYLTAFPKALRWFGRVLLQTEFARSRRIFSNAAALTGVSQTYLDWAVRRAGRLLRPSDGVYPLGFTLPETVGLPSDEELLALRNRLNIPAAALVAVFLGTFGASYDIETVIRAARLLHEAGSTDVHFVLAGDGEKMLAGRNLANGLSNLCLTGWVDNTTAIALSALSNIGLCAYSTRAIQSISYKPQEYMAWGLPLLSSLTGELRAILEAERCGTYYEAGNPRSFRDQILWFAANEVERCQMGKRARRLFERRFDASLIYQKLADLLEHMAKTQPS